MLKKIHGNAGENAPATTFGEAAFPVPFASGLEYNCPAHGTWNIVHTGMLVPGSHQIYVCTRNCGRGVVLTAAEMNRMDRFSMIAIEEEDLFNGEMEELVIEGVSEILRKLPKKPDAVLLFLVCVHHFMGCDIPYIYRRLRELHPGQRFIECYMDPIMQKGGMTPDQKLRIAMYSCLEPGKKRERQLSILGNDLPTQADSELFSLLRSAGWTAKDITACESFADYLSLSESVLNLTMYPAARAGGEAVSARLHTRHLHLPHRFSYEKLTENLAVLAKALGVPCPETDGLAAACEAEAARTKTVIGDAPVAVDAAAFPAVLSLTRFLLAHGFRVTAVYADAFSEEEREDFLWIREHAPDLVLFPTIHPQMRILPRKSQEKLLAIGQKAAYFTGTGYFVDVVEGGGLYGFRGVCTLLRWMREAWEKEKDAQHLITRKGWGCECLL